METIRALAPHVPGGPCVIGNCQAGWAIMGLAALRPDLPCPILVAGSPLSQSAGAPGLNPMRYTGDLLGGSWMTHLMSDLGAGIFDGADLVLNFEGLDPGLHEMLIEDKKPGMRASDLVPDRDLTRFERPSLEALAVLCGDRAGERPCEVVKWVS